MEAGIGPKHADRILAVVNPVSTGNQYGQNRALTELKDTYGDRIDYLYTEADPEVTTEKIAAELRGNDLVCAAGGDGTVTQVIDALRWYNQTAEDKPLLFIAPCGNGNDLARSVNKQWLHQPTKLLEQGVVRDYRPLLCTIMGKNGEREQLANYCAVGATGLGATYLNTAWHRNHPLYGKRSTRILLEAWQFCNAGRSAPPFLLTRAGAPDQIVADVTWVTIPEMAKCGRMPVTFGEHEIFMNTLRDTRMRSLAAWVGRMMLGIPEGEYANSFYVRCISQQPLKYHCNGESQELPPGSALHVRSVPPDQAVKIITAPNAASTDWWLRVLRGAYALTRFAS